MATRFCHSACVLVTGLFVLAAPVTCLAQQDQLQMQYRNVGDPEPQLQVRDTENGCAVVAFHSYDPALPVAVVEAQLRKRAEFRAAKLVLTDRRDQADAFVVLTVSGERKEPEDGSGDESLSRDLPARNDIRLSGDLGTSGARGTHIAVWSRDTGRHVSAFSTFTDFPGMIAADVMLHLETVCNLTPTSSGTDRVVAAATVNNPSTPMIVTSSPPEKHGFRHFVGRVGFYSGAVLYCTGMAVGYAALAIAMAEAGQ